MDPASQIVNGAHSSEWSRHPNPFVRLLKRDKPAKRVLLNALRTGALPVEPVGSWPGKGPFPAQDDYMLIDPGLHLEDSPGPPPPPGVGYAGLTAAQRHFFQDWLTSPTQPAPRAYRQIYLAQLETRLLEGKQRREAVKEELLRLLGGKGWADDPHLGRVLLLAGWLSQDGPFLVQTLSKRLPGALLGVGLGLQALLKTPLAPAEVMALAEEWRLPSVTPLPQMDQEVLRMRLESVASNLGQEPLAYALAQLPEEARAPRPWRAVHRDLRMAFPQPDLRPLLEPILREMLLAGPTHALVQTPEKPEAPSEPEEPGRASVRASDTEWLLILEFGESRSPFFDYVVSRARKLPSYQQIMDENRYMVHRVHFRKRDMRKFWRLWEYVQKWSSTRVYLNGEELEAWKIWPYSQYLR